MTIYTRPENTTIWAENGNISLPTTEKQEQGWVTEKPPSEMMNWIHNKQDKGIAYLLQEGISAWDAETEYSIGAITKYNDTVYKAKLQNLNKQPDTNPANWEIAFDIYGAAAEVQADLDNIKTTDEALPFYVRKAAPVMTAKAIGTSFSANAGLPNSDNSSNTGHSFVNDGDSGLFKDGSDVVITSENRLVARFPAATIPQTDSSFNIATTQWVKDALNNVVASLNASIEAIRVPVGNSIISSNPNNPATYFNYGTWELDVQGRALVGVSNSTSNAVPEWVKSVNQQSGDYLHTLTRDELPSIDVKYERFTGAQSGTFPITNMDGNGLMRYSEPTTVSSGGNSQPFNIVQPSKTKFIWTRTS